MSGPMELALLAAAEAWVEANPEKARELVARYSTVDNPFLHAAEEAWFKATEQIPAPVSSDEDMPPRHGCFVYRLWAADGRLLYVGSTVRLRRRLARHRSTYGDLIAHATWVEYPNAGLMLDAERAAIADELPALNKALV